MASGNFWLLKVPTHYRVWVGATFTLGMLEPIEVLALGRSMLYIPDA